MSMFPRTRDTIFGPTPPLVAERENKKGENHQVAGTSRKSSACSRGAFNAIGEGRLAIDSGVLQYEVPPFLVVGIGESKLRSCNQMVWRIGKGDAGPVYQSIRSRESAQGTESDALQDGTGSIRLKSQPNGYIK